MVKSLWAAAALMFLATSATASVTVTLSAAAGHPSLDVKVSGSGFSPDAYAVNGGNAAVYRRDPSPPAYASLHPDFRLKARSH